MTILHNIDFNLDMLDPLKTFLKNKNIEKSQDGIHFGNYCLINIPDDLKNEIFRKFEKELNTGYIQYRNKKTIMEKEDFGKYKIGEKITIEYLETDFFPVTNQKGMIFDIKNESLVIRAFRSKNKGWHISAGTNCKIKKGW